jgi:hypothetical protein
MTLHCSIHQGVLTKHPFFPSLAEKEAFLRLYFSNQLNQHEAQSDRLHNETLILYLVDYFLHSANLRYSVELLAVEVEY